MSKTFRIDTENKNLMINFNSENKEIKDSKFIYRVNSENKFLIELDRIKKYQAGINVSINSTFFTEIKQNTFNFRLTYCYDKEIDFSYVIDGSEFKISDGIPYKLTREGQFLTLNCYVKHNLKIGQFILISGKSYQVIDFGLNPLNSDRVVRVLFSDSADVSTYNTFKKIQDPNNLTTVSEYYIEKLKFIDTEVISNILPLGRNLISGRSNINSGPNSVINYQNILITIDSFDITNLVDENNIPISQLSFYVILNGYVNDLIWDFNRFNESDVSNVNFNNPRTLFTTLDSRQEIFGDFVEFDSINFTKTILSKSFTKVLNTDPTKTFFGYYNNLKINIFAFDSLVRTSLYQEDAPNYAKYNESIGLWFWRDIIPYSSNSEDIIRFSFINKKHIINDVWNIYLENEVNNFNTDNFFNTLL